MTWYAPKINTILDKDIFRTLILFEILPKVC